MVFFSNMMCGGEKQDSLCLKYLHSDEHLEIAMFSDETIFDKHAV